jgi:hypothetical protein
METVDELVKAITDDGGQAILDIVSSDSMLFQLFTN